jgi:regulatory protein
MNTTSDVSSLKKYFLNILAKKDYSKAELYDKGILRGFDTGQIETIISELVSRNFVNDLRLAENVVQSYQGKKGKMWLKQKLAQKKIPADIIVQTLNNLEPMSDDSLKEKVAKKYGVSNWKNLENSQKQKILQYLQRQGFTNVWAMIKDWAH